jgi:ectoine hydroxylase-related dioxygenase (phytanoyl-CoA dioxygenase family)
MAVVERREAEGFSAWTIKGEVPHVEPPLSLLNRMVTLRLHIDPVAADNAPLLIAPGSHRYGRIAEAEIDEVVARCGQFECLAEAGDIWVYRSLILHASKAAVTVNHRRVLQVDFSADNLPSGLVWYSDRPARASS